LKHTNQSLSHCRNNIEFGFSACPLDRAASFGRLRMAAQDAGLGWQAQDGGMVSLSNHARKQNRISTSVFPVVEGAINPRTERAMPARGRMVMEAEI
jgi:hypothetical protein